MSIQSLRADPAFQKLPPNEQDELVKQYAREEQETERWSTATPARTDH